MSGAFKDRDFAHRFDVMGDTAELRFEEYATNTLKRGYVRYGLSRPPLQMFRLPARVRYTPDFLMSDRFVEVQGLGRDQFCKLKHDKLGSLRWWNDIQKDGFTGVWFFIWDSHRKRECLFPIGMLDDLLADEKASLGVFQVDRKAYLQFHADDVFAAAEAYVDAT